MLEEYARAATQKAAIEARLERRIVELKSKDQPKLDNLDAAMASLSAAITEFITANRSAFAKPRTRKTSFGEYGLRTVTSLDVQPDTAADETIFIEIKAVDFLDCIQITEALCKPNIIARIQTSPEDAAWFAAHGVTLKTGDTVVLKVAKALIDQAKQEPQS